MGPSSLLTVDLEVETSMPVPALMVKKLAGDVLEHLANNLKNRANTSAQLLVSPTSRFARAARSAAGRRRRTPRRRFGPARPGPGA